MFRGLGLRGIYFRWTPPPSNSDFLRKMKVIFGSAYIPILPLLQGGGPPNPGAVKTS